MSWYSCTWRSEEIRDDMFGMAHIVSAVKFIDTYLNIKLVVK